MARVPTYDDLQVAAAPLRAPGEPARVSGDQFTTSARADAALGKGLGDAGTGLMAAGAQIAERENADAVLRAETAVKDEYLKYERGVREKRQGRNAVGVTDDTTKWWDDSVKTAEEKLGNDEQRRMLRIRLAGTRQSSLHSISGFEAEHRQKSYLESEDAALAADIGLAAANPNADTVAKARASIMGSTARVGQTLGWDEAKLAGERMKRTTKLHQEVFNYLLNSKEDYMAAKAYFDANKGEIDGTQHDVFSKALREGGKDVLAQNFRDEVLQAGMTEAQAVEEARKRFSGPQEEHVVARIKQYFGEKKEAIRGPVNEDIMGGKIRTQAALQTDPRYMNADPDERVKMLQFFQAKQHNDLARANAAESLAYTREQRRRAEIEYNGEPVLARLMDPESLVAMDRNALLAYGDVIGPKNTQQLLTRYDALKANASKLAEAKIDHDQFKVIADAAGFKASEPPSKLNPEQRANLVTLKDRVEGEIALIEQQRGKQKPLTREEKGAIMQRIVDDQVIRSRDWWFDAKQPGVLLKAGDAEKAYVVVNGEELMLSSVPPDYRQYAAGKLRANGKPLTQSAVAQMWVLDRAAWGKRDPAKRVPQ